MNKGYKIWRLIFTSCIQGIGAPLIDKAFIRDKEGNGYKAIAILLLPWKKNQYGESLIQKALVIGWRLK